MKKTAFLGILLAAIATVATNVHAQQIQTMGNFQFVDIGGYRLIVRYTGPGGAVNFPAGLVTGFTLIGEAAFADRGITSVTIPNGVVVIGESAFEGNQLSSVIIPNSVTHISDFAFNDNFLTSVTIGTSVMEIGARAFSINQLTSVTLPNSVRNLGLGSFGFNPITSITIGAGVDIFAMALIDGQPGYTLISGFEQFYDAHGRQAGTYTRPNANSTTWTRR